MLQQGQPRTTIGAALVFQHRFQKGAAPVALHDAFVLVACTTGYYSRTRSQNGTRFIGRPRMCPTFVEAVFSESESLNHIAITASQAPGVVIVLAVGDVRAKKILRFTRFANQLDEIVECRLWNRRSHSNDVEAL